MMRIIYIIRNPLDRFVSHYMHLKRKGFIQCTMDQAFDKYPIMTDTGRYFQQIQPYPEQFGRDQVSIVNFKDFVSSRDQVLKIVCEFIGVEGAPLLTYGKMWLNRSIGQSLKELFNDWVITNKFSQWIKYILHPKWTYRAIDYTPLFTKYDFEERPLLSKETRSKLLDIYNRR